MADYDYDKDSVDLELLKKEILESSITNVSTEFSGLKNTKESTPAKNLYVTFESGLSGGDEATLDGIVAAHNSAGAASEGLPVEAAGQFYFGGSSSKDVYTVVGAFIFPGWTAVGAVPTAIKVASHMDSKATSYSVRLYSVGDRVTLAESTGLTNTESAIQALGAIAARTSWPKTEQLVEVQVKVATPGNTAYLPALKLRYS